MEVSGPEAAKAFFSKRKNPRRAQLRLEETDIRAIGLVSCAQSTCQHFGGIENMVLDRLLRYVEVIKRLSSLTAARMDKLDATREQSRVVNSCLWKVCLGVQNFCV